MISSRKMVIQQDNVPSSPPDNKEDGTIVETDSSRGQNVVGDDEKESEASPYNTKQLIVRLILQALVIWQVHAWWNSGTSYVSKVFPSFNLNA